MNDENRCEVDGVEYQAEPSFSTCEDDWGCDECAGEFDQRLCARLGVCYLYDRRDRQNIIWRQVR